jgi:hypothetical protein
MLSERGNTIPKRKTKFGWKHDQCNIGITVLTIMLKNQVLHLQART